MAVARRPPRLAVVDQRPQTRGECVDGPRPCPWISCRHHVVEVVASRRGMEVLGLVLSEIPAVADEEAWTEDVADAVASLPESCVLDLIEREPDGVTLQDVASVFGLTRERIRQVETRGIQKIGRLRRRVLREFTR